MYIYKSNSISNIEMNSNSNINLETDTNKQLEPTTAYERLKSYCEKNNRMELFNTRINQQVEMILRQTDYDEETAKNKLIEYDLNTFQIIRDYMRGYRDLDKHPYSTSQTQHTNNHSQSTQQTIYGEFRKFLDDASTRFYKQQEFNEKAKQLYDHQQNINTKIE
jgi:hypothetical protein